MKRILSLILLLLLFSGCAKQAEPAIDVMDGTLALPSQSTLPADAAKTESSSFGINPRIELLDSVAYSYDSGDGLLLYGAVEFENTGDCPVHLASASFRFTDESGGVHLEEFVPPLNDYDIVMPGERSYVCAWFDNTAFAAGSILQLSAELKPLRIEAFRQALSVDELFLADNYPRFTTMTGRIHNAGELSSSLNMIYAGFYDENGKLLCVYYFTKNAQLETGDDIRFVTHMRQMPFTDLAERSKAIRAVGFGF